MRDNDQREFLASLRRPQINQLCLEMQAIISNLKLFLAETYGFSEDETSKIMLGRKFEDIESLGAKPPARRKGETDPRAQSEHTPKCTTDTAPISTPADLAQLKKEDEMIRRSLMFELEWCMAQIEQGNYPS